jgi:hypothetical protein
MDQQLLQQCTATSIVMDMKQHCNSCNLPMMFANVLPTQILWQGPPREASNFGRYLQYEPIVC